MSRMPVIAFRPTAEQYQKFKALQIDGRSMSDIVKELVDKGLGSPFKDGQNISELIRQRLGLVQLNGQVHDGTNVPPSKPIPSIGTNVPVVDGNLLPISATSQPKPTPPTKKLEGQPKFVPDGTNYNSKPEKKRRGWGWLWWLLVAAVVLGAIYFFSQIQIYYWGG